MTRRQGLVLSIGWVLSAWLPVVVLAGDPFVPNDPYYSSQWHLDKQATGAVVDANVAGAWAKGWTGQGVRIGIADTGTVQQSHPDLTANYAPGYDLRLGLDESHATNCAGIAAGVGGNGIGITGAAPNAQFCSVASGSIPLNLDVYDERSAQQARHRNDAIDIKSWSVGLSQAFGMACEYVRMPQITQATSESAAAGTINVRAAANSRWNANKFGDKNIFGQIVVGAVGSNGTFSNYSDYGASLTVCAPSNTAGGLGITTTTTGSGYISDFGGTSAATPLVSGILALAKEAQPNLDTRLAKHLLARTSQVVDPNDSTRFAYTSTAAPLPDPTVATPTGGWHTNAAGIHFNNNYGFGMIDAEALCDAAQQYSGVTSLTTQTTGNITVGSAIPEDGSLSRMFTLGDYGHIEDLSFDFSLTGIFKSSVKMLITSPSGTVSLVQDGYVSSSSSTGTASTRDWTYLTNAFWGENPFGTWTVTMRDLPWNNPYEMVDNVMWNSFGITANYGDLIAVPEPTTLMVLVIGSLGLLRRRPRCT